MNPFLKFKYRHSCDLGGIPYTSLPEFYLYIYLDADIQQPFYEEVEDGEENGEKDFVPTFQKSVKRYVIKTDVLPEHLADALKRMRLHDYIELLLKTGENQRVYNVQVEIEYPFDDSYATATISFDMGERVVVSQCCL